MFNVTLIVFIFLGSLAFANPNKCSGLFTPKTNDLNHSRIQFSVSEDISAESLNRLNMIVEQALKFFELKFYQILEPVEIRVGSKSSALRTGYDFKDGSLNFPEIENIENFGLNSIDVIHHELFHLLICRGFPKICVPELLTDQSVIRLHEALADYFAYKLNSDSHFGEHYFSSKKYIRNYDNDLTLSLTEGAHGDGNAIAKYLIKNKITLDQIKAFLASGRFDLNALSAISPELDTDIRQDLTYILDEETSNYPLSSKRKYRLVSENPLQLKFIANGSLQSAMPQLRIEWTDENGNLPTHFEIRSAANNLEFTVSPLPGAKSEKVIAVIYSQNKMIGYRAFYFGLDLKN